MHQSESFRTLLLRGSSMGIDKALTEAVSVSRQKRSGVLAFDVEYRPIAKYVDRATKIMRRCQDVDEYPIFLDFSAVLHKNFNRQLLDSISIRERMDLYGEGENGSHGFVRALRLIDEVVMRVVLKSDDIFAAEIHGSGRQDDRIIPVWLRRQSYNYDTSELLFILSNETMLPSSVIERFSRQGECTGEARKFIGTSLSVRKSMCADVEWPVHIDLVDRMRECFIRCGTRQGTGHLEAASIDLFMERLRSASVRQIHAAALRIEQEIPAAMPGIESVLVADFEGMLADLVVRKSRRLLITLNTSIES